MGLTSFFHKQFAINSSRQRNNAGLIFIHNLLLLVNNTKHKVHNFIFQFRSILYAKLGIEKATIQCETEMI